MSKRGNNNREMIYRNHRAQGTANRSKQESRKNILDGHAQQA